MKKMHESEVREFDNYLEFYSLIDSWDFSETSWVKKNAQGGIILKKKVGSCSLIVFMAKNTGITLTSIDSDFSSMDSFYSKLSFEHAEVIATDEGTYNISIFFNKNGSIMLNLA